jgi:ABC-type phosphate/phosphonate transport system permease subunit
LIFRDFPRAGTVLVVTILMVLIVDAISAAIRRRIIKGREITV